MLHQSNRCDVNIAAHYMNMGYELREFMNSGKIAPNDKVQIYEVPVFAGSTKNYIKSWYPPETKIQLFRNDPKFRVRFQVYDQLKSKLTAMDSKDLLALLISMTREQNLTPSGIFDAAPADLDLCLEYEEPSIIPANTIINPRELLYSSKHGDLAPVLMLTLAVGPFSKELVQLTAENIDAIEIVRSDEKKYPRKNNLTKRTTFANRKQAIQAVDLVNAATMLSETTGKYADEDHTTLMYELVNLASIPYLEIVKFVKSEKPTLKQCEKILSFSPLFLDALNRLREFVTFNGTLPAVLDQEVTRMLGYNWILTGKFYYQYMNNNQVPQFKCTPNWAKQRNELMRKYGMKSSKFEKFMEALESSHTNFIQLTPLLFMLHDYAYMRGCDLYTLTHECVITRSQIIEALDVVHIYMDITDEESEVAFINSFLTLLMFRLVADDMSRFREEVLFRPLDVPVNKNCSKKDTKNLNMLQHELGKANRRIRDLENSAAKDRKAYRDTIERDNVRLNRENEDLKKRIKILESQNEGMKKQLTDADTQLERTCEKISEQTCEEDGQLIVDEREFTLVCHRADYGKKLTKQFPNMTVETNAFFPIGDTPKVVTIFLIGHSTIQYLNSNGMKYLPLRSSNLKLAGAEIRAYLDSLDEKKAA